MANASKKKGTAAETKVVRFLKERGIQAQRRALTGSKDCGDVEYEHAGGKSVIEVKAGKMTQAYSRGAKETWLEQARAEEVNSGMACVLVIVKYNRSINDAEVWSADGHTFMYLNEWADQLAERNNQ